MKEGTGDKKKREREKRDEQRKKKNTKVGVIQARGTNHIYA
jgi:hypothetical protein